MAYLLLRDLQFAGDLLSVLDSQLIQLNGGKERGPALTMQHFPDGHVLSSVESKTLGQAQFGTNQSRSPSSYASLCSRS